MSPRWPRRLIIEDQTEMQGADMAHGSNQFCADIPNFRNSIGRDRYPRELYRRARRQHADDRRGAAPGQAFDRLAGQLPTVSTGAQNRHSDQRGGADSRSLCYPGCVLIEGTVQTLTGGDPTERKAC